MIIKCDGCAAKYFLPEAKTPPNRMKVRCPQCRAVFTLIPQVQTVGAGGPAPVAPDAQKAPPKPDPVPQAVAPPPPSPRITAKPKATPPGSPKVSPKPKAAPKKSTAARSKKPAASRGDARAKRLARVLVSDILCYNQEKRDKALIDGDLMAVLGDEIKKSWELYKEKIGPELAKSTDYFKEALNDILADGQKVF